MEGLGQHSLSQDMETMMLPELSKPLWIPPAPGKSSKHCNSVANAGTGKRLIYAYCTKPRGHEDETEHYDGVRNFRWSAPLLFWSDFMP